MRWRPGRASTRRTRRRSPRRRARAWRDRRAGGGRARRSPTPASAWLRPPRRATARLCAHPYHARLGRGQQTAGGGPLPGPGGAAAHRADVCELESGQRASAHWRRVGEALRALARLARRGCERRDRPEGVGGPYQSLQAAPLWKTIVFSRANGVAMAIDTVGNLDHLDTAIQKVEFKTTAVPADDDKVKQLVDAHGGPRLDRKIYFYDTPDLELSKLHVFLRARENDGNDNDSTVKLRPITLPAVEPAWEGFEDTRVELDVVGEKHVPSAKLDGKPKKDKIDNVRDGGPVKSLFSDEQEGLIALLAQGIALSDLAVLGPIKAHKWDLAGLDPFTHELSIEEWRCPDGGPHFFELSFKVGRDEAGTAHADFVALLERLGIESPAEQDAKTQKVLEFFAQRLD